MRHVTQHAKKMPLCFVIGPIGSEGSSERKHSDLLLNAVTKYVLQQEEFGYLVKRADEDADPGMIADRVVSDIINAELVVADLTELNPNAFYELGIRHSTEKPTIHIARVGTLLPFDNVAHRTIFVDLSDWQSIEQARERLSNSARAIKAPDYRVSNPITQANASFKMRQSEDPRDQIVAQIQERMAAIESSLLIQGGSSLPNRLGKSRLTVELVQNHIKQGNLKQAARLYVDHTGASFDDALKFVHAINDSQMAHDKEIKTSRRVDAIVIYHSTVPGVTFDEGVQFVEHFEH